MIGHHLTCLEFLHHSSMLLELFHPCQKVCVVVRSVQNPHVHHPCTWSWLSLPYHYNTNQCHLMNRHVLYKYHSRTVDERRHDNAYLHLSKETYLRDHQDFLSGGVVSVVHRSHQFLPFFCQTTNHHESIHKS